MSACKHLSIQVNAQAATIPSATDPAMQLKSRMVQPQLASDEVGRCQTAPCLKWGVSDGPMSPFSGGANPSKADKLDSAVSLLHSKDGDSGRPTILAQTC
eukprot:5698789-Amphidinium_carterae.1